MSQDTSNDYLKEKVEDLIKTKSNDEALKVALQSLQKSEEISNYKSSIYWNNVIGEIFKKNDIYNKSLLYYKNAFKTSKYIKDTTNIIKSIYNIASLYNKEYSVKSFNSGNLNKNKNLRDSAFVKYHELLSILPNNKKFDTIAAKTYANLSGLYSYSLEFKKADESSRKAAEYFKKINDTISIIGVKSNIGVSQILRKEYNKAEKNFIDLLPLLKDTANNEILTYKITTIINLSEIYKAKKDFKNSLKQLENHINLQNVADKRKYKQEIVSIEERYSQEKALLVEKEKSEVMKFWFGVFFVLAIVAIILIYTSYRNNKLKSRNLALKLIKKELERTNELEKIENENQNKVLNATLDARVKERKYISEVLHDSVSSLLSSANMHIQVVKNKTESNIDELDKSSKIIKEASDKVRDLSHKLTSAILLKFGLATATLDLCEKYTNSDLTFELENEEEIPRFNESFEIRIHNIIEELTNNIIKHSGASYAKIELKHINHTLLIDIHDNGTGFNIEKTKIKNGIGLKLIQSRIKTLNGTINIESSNKNGTNIHISVPTKNKYSKKQTHSKFKN